jgi:hypothetical protein
LRFGDLLPRIEGGPSSIRNSAGVITGIVGELLHDAQGGRRRTAPDRDMDAGVHANRRAAAPLD